MHRTQLLLAPDLHWRAEEAAKARRLSLGQLMREALKEYLARSGGVQPSPEAIDQVLLGEPFDDSNPDPHLSTNVDHYLYGAAGRARRR